MNNYDPNLTIVAQVLDALGPLADSLVLVGGCAVGLLITDQARPPVRETIDVDMVTQVATLTDYYATESQLRQRGFNEVATGQAHFCRWTKGGLILDILPSDERVLGHSTNRWYPLVVSNPAQIQLPSNHLVRVISAPLFIATKLEAFASRGNGDYLRHDMEDIVNVVDGRPELSDEIHRSDANARQYIKEEFEMLITDERFVDVLPGHFQGDSVSQARKDIVFDRMRQIAGF